MRDRASYAFALVSVAAVIDAQGGKVRSARMALGGVAHKPWRVEAAETMLTTGPAGERGVDAASDAMLDGAQGYGENDFKVPLARRTLRAVLRDMIRL